MKRTLPLKDCLTVSKIKTAFLLAVLLLCTIAPRAFAQCSPDVTAPVISNCPANITVNAQSGQCQVKVTAFTTAPTVGHSLDQSVPSSYIGFSGAIWQTFTAGQTGKLVYVGFFKNGCITNSGTLSIYSGTGTGGTLLYSTPYTIGGCSGMMHVGIPFFVAPTITSGQKYTMYWSSISAVLGGSNTETSSYSGYDLNFETYVQPIPAAPSATDNCSGTTFTSNYQPGDNFPVGTTTVTYTAKDASNNTSTCSFNVTVVDDQNPIITCPANITQNAPSGTCFANVTVPAPVVSDNCGVASVTNNYTNTNNASGVYPKGTTQVTWTVTDIHGRKSTCVQTIIVTQTVSLTCAANITLAATPGTCGRAITVPQPATSGLCAGLELTNNFNGTSDASGTYPIGVTNVVWTFKDVTTGAFVNCTQVITVTEAHTLSITCPANITKTADAGICGANVTVPVPVFSAGAGNSSCLVLTNNFNNTGNASGLYPKGTTTVIWTLKHGSGDQITCSQTVTVTDNEQPTFNCADIIVNTATPDACSAVFNTRTGSQVLDQTISSSYIGFSGAIWQTFTPGLTGRLTTVGFFKNGCITNSGTLNIYQGEGTGGTLLYSAPYTIGGCSGMMHVGIPFDVAVQLTAGQKYTMYWSSISAVLGGSNTEISSYSGYDLNFETYMWALPTTVSASPAAKFAMITAGGLADDNCNIATFTSNHQLGETLPVGSTPVTWTAVDDAGNTKVCNFNIIVRNTNTLSSTLTPTAVCSNNPFAYTPASTVSGTTFSWTRAAVTGISNAAASGNGSINETLVNTTGAAINVVYMYTCTANGCSGTPVAVTVSVKPGPTVAITPSGATTFCPGGSVTLTASGASTYSWSTGATTAAITVSATGNYTVTGTSSGCTAAATRSVTVLDNLAPVVTCPANISVNAAAGTCVATASFAATGTDNCTAPGALTFTYSQNPGTSFPVGTTTVTVTAKDASNNVSAPCSFTVTVTDNQVPVVTCPANITMNAAAGTCAANVSFTATATDNCTAPGALTFTYSQNPGTSFPVGTTTVTVTAKDASNNVSAPCSFTVTVTDNQAPAVTCPANITMNATAGTCAANASFTATATDNCTANPALTYSQNPGTSFPVGTTTVTVTAKDASNNVSAPCSFTVTVTDNQNPTITAPANRTVRTNTACSATGVTLGTPATADNCAVASVTNNAPATYPLGNTTVIWTVTDVNGRTATANQVITVNDSTAPVITCPANISVNNNTGICGAAVNYAMPAVNDNCSGGAGLNPVVNGSFENNYTGWTLSSTNSGSTYGILSTGQTISSGQQLFDYFNNANENQSSPGLPYTAAPTDGNKMAIFLQIGGGVHNMYQDINLPSGNINLKFDLRYNNTAGSFNASSQFFSIVLRNPTTNALIATIFKTTQGVDPQTLPMTAKTVDLSAYAGQTVRLQMIEATINNNWLDVMMDNVRIEGGTDLQQTAGLPSGSVFPVGTTTNTFVATDAAGNQSTCSQTVTVADNEAPAAICKNITVQLDNSGNASITTADVNNNSTDNCGIASVTASPLSFNCANVGPNTVTLTVTDIYGNVSACNAAVTVEDNVAPVAVAQNLVVQLDNTGTASITAAQVDNGSGDACGIASMTVAPNGFTCANVGPNTVTLTVTDNNGNVTTATSTVMVEDNVAPVAICKNITVQLDATGDVAITGNDVDNGSDDACGIASLSVSPNNFTCANVGPNTVTLTVVDYNGNVSTCTSTVTVQDNVAPVAVAQNLTVQLDNTGNGGITAAQVNNGSADACGIASLSVSPDNFNCDNVGANTVTLTVTDVNGNVSTATAVITVEDNVAPVAICKNITVQLDATGNVAITGDDVNNGSDDACGIASLSVSPNSFTCANVGPNTVTLTVTDNKGNISTCTSTVTVEDNVAPVAVAQNLTVQLDNTGNGGITAAQVNNGSADACGIASLSVSPNSFTCANVGPNTVTLTVTDVNGNVSTATAVVTVEDNVAPVAICQNLTVQLDANGNGSITAAQVNNGSNDACGIASMTVSPNSFTCSNVGPNTVTLTLTDNNGNVSTCTSTVTVEDNVAPIAICKNYTLNLSNGTGSITPADVNNGSNDACSIASMTVSPNTFTCANAGPNTVILTVTDNNGNTSTCTSTVMVQYQPTCSIAVNPANNTYTGGVPTNIYLGYGPQSATVTANPTGGSGFTYSWSPASGLSCSTCQNPVFTPTTSGVYTYTVTATNSNGCSTTCTVSFCVKDIREKDNKGNFNGKVIMTHIPPGNPNNPQNLSVSVNAVPSHLGQHSGDYLGSANQTCTSGAKEGLAENEEEHSHLQSLVKEMKVYPNPSKGIFFVELPEAVKGGEAVIMDMNGKMVERTRFMPDTKLSFDLSSVAKGVYMIQIINGTDSYRARIVIQE